jgi:hypothetical protein
MLLYLISAVAQFGKADEAGLTQLFNEHVAQLTAGRVSRKQATLELHIWRRSQV